MDWIDKELQVIKHKIPVLEISALICQKCLKSYCRRYLPTLYFSTIRIQEITLLRDSVP